MKDWEIGRLRVRDATCEEEGKHCCSSSGSIRKWEGTRARQLRLEHTRKLLPPTLRPDKHRTLIC